MGNTSIFIVKAAVNALVDSYNEHYQTDFTVPDEDINTLFGNFRVFVNNFADADPKIRNAVFEEMFMAECSKKESEKLVNMQKRAENKGADEAIKDFEALFRQFRNPLGGGGRSSGTQST